jgi:hypothetical protein
VQTLERQGDIRNLTNRLNVINFASVFSGTALASPRAYSIRLRFGFQLRHSERCSERAGGELDLRIVRLELPLAEEEDSISYKGEIATITLFSNEDCWKVRVAYRGILDVVAGEYADKSSAKAAAEQQAREWIERQLSRP